MKDPGREAGTAWRFDEAVFGDEFVERVEYQEQRPGARDDHDLNQR